jgi:hypothetical protein
MLTTSKHASTLNNIREGDVELGGHGCPRRDARYGDGPGGYPTLEITCNEIHSPAVFFVHVK